MPSELPRRRLAVARLRYVGIWFVAGWTIGVGIWVFGPALLFGWSPTVVASGSMEPAIRTGDVVLIDERADTALVGAVVRFGDASGQFTLHRVTAVAPDGRLWTKGDANGRVDTTPVQVKQVSGRAVLLVPYAAHPLSVAMMVVMALVAAGRAGMPRLQSVRAAAVGRAGLMVVLLVLAVPVAARASFSATTDTGGSTMQAAVLAAPSSPSATCGVIGVGSGTINVAWSASPSPGLTGYEILHRIGAGPLQHLTFVGPSTTGYSHVFDPALLGVGQYRYAIRAVAGTFVSPATAEVSRNLTRVLGVYVCG